MKIVYDRWQGDRCPYGWAVERHTEYTHLHGEVRADGYALIPQGNLHLPLTPELEEFELAVSFQVDPALTGGDFDLSLVFRYDRRRRRGSAVRLDQRGDTLRLAFGTQHGNQFECTEEQAFPAIALCAEPMHAALEVTGSTATVRFGGHTVQFDGVSTGTGSVALCRGCFFGELLIRRLEIKSDDDIPRESVLAQTTVEFPPEVGGMDVSFRYTVKVSRQGSMYEIEVELSGGAPEKVYEHPGNYHCRVIDWLTRPYIQFVGLDAETTKLYLSDDTLALCAKPIPNAFFYGQFYDEPEWPLKRRFRVESFPAEPLLVLGYEHYCCEVAQQRQRGPTEVFFDPVSKEIRHWGSALAKHDAEIRFESPANTRLLEQLPTSDPRHAQAVEHIRNNHFFSESDDCEFALAIDCGSGLDPDELRVRARLENAFFEPFEDYRQCPVTAAVCVVPKRRQACAEVSLGNKLGAGVYHLRAQLQWGGRTVERYCAFEVMPASPGAPIAPRASGLPVMFNMPNEITCLETDCFDPWHGISDDVAHYTSICCFYPDFARTHRIWDVVRLYGREWFAWITSRTTDRPSLDQHMDLVGECDFLCLRDDPYTDEIARWLARLSCYTGTVLKILRQFVAETGRDIAVPQGPRLDRETFARLLDECWHEWLAYYGRFYLQRLLKPIQDRLRERNPELKFAGYGPYQAYAAHYKGTHHL
ncbi:MAG: hypothetical protein KAI66_01355, partial [Lentisphaeria bacterium]|nr:hypothetical protein [Lentisphaeria bacterium]